jgi:predicted dehydrogenase
MTEVLTSPQTKTRLAFIGTGWIGLDRMKSLLKEQICEPVAVLDPSADNVQRAKESAPSAVVHASMEELFAQKPEGIVIATPSAMHAEQSIAALKQGIPVFCQKPLARNAQESLEVINVARKMNKRLGVDLSYRYTQGMRKIYQLTRNKELGDIYAIDLVFHNAYGPDKNWFYNPALSGGGCLVDLGIHLVDLALWILNFPEIKTVSSVLMAKGKVIDNTNANVCEDYASAQMITESGVVIRLTCSWNLQAGQDAEIKASYYGTYGSALFSNVNGSFFDFETRLCHGTKNEIISNPPDDWGGRALIAWTKKIQEDNSFSEEAMQYYKVAKVLDRIYKRNITPLVSYSPFKTMQEL